MRVWDPVTVMLLGRLHRAHVRRAEALWFEIFNTGAGTWTHAKEGITWIRGHHADGAADTVALLAANALAAGSR